MPHNGSIDIPHVAVTDHFIRKRPVEDSQQKKITAFLGMKCFNNDKPDAITTARGFMEFYERYAQSGSLLDSALHYLSLQSELEAAQKQNRDYIRVYYLLKDYPKVVSYANASCSQHLHLMHGQLIAQAKHIISCNSRIAHSRGISGQRKYGNTPLILKINMASAY